jgi:hypothetical protein
MHFVTWTGVRVLFFALFFSTWRFCTCAYWIVKCSLQLTFTSRHERTGNYFCGLCSLGTSPWSQPSGWSVLWRAKQLSPGPFTWCMLCRWLRHCADLEMVARSNCIHKAVDFLFVERCSRNRGTFLSCFLLAYCADCYAWFTGRVYMTWI